MSRTAIVTDSNSGITQDAAKRLGIYVLPMPFEINGKTYMVKTDGSGYAKQTLKSLRNGTYKLKIITPAGTRSLSINPLNWRTDAAPADAALNLGACFTDYSGTIKAEIPQLCGAYLDETRGVLKVPGLDAGKYPPVVPGMPQGAYHVYDYMFFFRNLQKNVADRVNAYLSAASR